MHPFQAIATIWGIWVASWIAASVWSARTKARPGAGRGLYYYLFTFAGAWMLFATPSDGRVPETLGWALFGFTALGFVFAWWARLTLGALWSGTVTRKEGHHVVDTGPYRLVRHPIYTGIILSSLATAVDKATPIAILGAGAMALGWYLKARLEERFLSAELGADAYGAYASKVPMLVPLLRI